MEQWKARCIVAVALLFYDFLTKCEFKQVDDHDKSNDLLCILVTYRSLFYAVPAYFLRSDICFVIRFVSLFFPFHFFLSHSLFLSVSLSHLLAKRTGVIKKSFMLCFIV